jgi:hypothetical protein
VNREEAFARSFQGHDLSMSRYYAKVRHLRWGFDGHRWGEGDYIGAVKLDSAWIREQGRMWDWTCNEMRFAGVLMNYTPAAEAVMAETREADWKTYLVAHRLVYPEMYR